VTAACLSCHVQAADQVMKTIHWTWVCPKSIKSGRPVGKAHVINNFCISLVGNEPRCTSCHAGYGWKDSSFDFSDRTLVDCLVCHDTTATYRKFPTMAGHVNTEPKTFEGQEWAPPDLGMIARSVGRPSRNNCGACHFYGGGGEGVKHADLDPSLSQPTRALDVHMDAHGLNYSCQDCHTTRDHAISGRCYGVPAAEDQTFKFPRSKEDSHIYCESCHGNAPHGSKNLNDHVDRVSCQACHIPRASRELPTKSSWDWSQAGRRGPEGQVLQERDASGRVVYDSRKGAFTWDRDFVPEYVWFNGAADSVLLGDTIDPSAPVAINHLRGGSDDPRSRIWPVKVHRARQPYDPVNRTLVAPKLFGPKGSGAYWADFDWTKAVAEGMEAAKQPFSGQVDFVATEMSWPITHMVAPKEDAVKCGECHARNGGRLSALGGFYLPGRDRFVWLDRFGWTVSALTLAVVLGHGAVRATWPRLRRRRPAKKEA
jgi:octaheme c-type cytochrome (tetrathionate reductase family)